MAATEHALEVWVYDKGGAFKHRYTQYTINSPRVGEGILIGTTFYTITRIIHDFNARIPGGAHTIRLYVMPGV